MGIFIAVIIFCLWASNLFLALNYAAVDFTSPLFYILVLLQAYLFTGLFITAHDAMHGTVSGNKTVNKITGTLAAFLFAGMSYNKLLKNHKLHHLSPGTGDDPDFSVNSGNFFVWFAGFMWKYLSILQVLIAAVIFNILKLRFPEISVWFYYVIPAFISALQLFYFGTYRPHRMPHTHDMQPHNSRTLKTNHIWAMLSCYFFGYHSEHHAAPHIPWWQLYRTK